MNVQKRKFMCQHICLTCLYARLLQSVSPKQLWLAGSFPSGCTLCGTRKIYVPTHLSHMLVRTFCNRSHCAARRVCLGTLLCQSSSGLFAGRCTFCGAVWRSVRRRLPQHRHTPPASIQKWAPEGALTSKAASSGRRLFPMLAAWSGRRCAKFKY